MEPTTKPSFYTEHLGTIKVAGRTSPKSAGYCALNYLRQGISPIDFFYIGGNAGQQATKAMTVFAFLVGRDPHQPVTIAFHPMLFLTMTKDPTTGQEQEKNATVWRVIIVEPEKVLPVKT